LLNWISNIRHILCKWKIRNQSISPPCWNLVWRSICLHDLRFYKLMQQKLVYTVTHRNNRFIEKHDATIYKNKDMNIIQYSSAIRENKESNI
jgi:hypothetical protein